ncbi:hypothetical protein [Dysgonomonas sp. 521]|nr:hypothetical protein [Dysgonomonas sp. 521]
MTKIIQTRFGDDVEAVACPARLSSFTGTHKGMPLQQDIKFCHVLRDLL